MKYERNQQTNSVAFVRGVQERSRTLSKHQFFYVKQVEADGMSHIYIRTSLKTQASSV